MFRQTMADESSTHIPRSMPVSSRPKHPGRRYSPAATPQRGKTIREQGLYAEAEKAHLLALAEAEKFVPEDSRLATSLNNLARLYLAQGRYPEVEPLLRRALSILKESVGTEIPGCDCNSG